MQVKHDSKIYPEMYVYQVLAGLGTGGILSSTGYITGINSNYGDYGKSQGTYLGMLPTDRYESCFVRHNQPMPNLWRLSRLGIVEFDFERNLYSDVEVQVVGWPAQLVATIPGVYEHFTCTAEARCFGCIRTGVSMAVSVICVCGCDGRLG